MKQVSEIPNNLTKLIAQSIFYLHLYTLLKENKYNCYLLAIQNDNLQNWSASPHLKIVKTQIPIFPLPCSIFNIGHCAKAQSQ